MSDQTPITPPPASTPPAAPSYQAPAANAYQAAPAYQSTGYAAPAKWNVLSIVALVVGVVGFGWLSLGAVITGHISLNQIKKTGEQGNVLAIIGLILGYLGVVTSIIVFLAVLIPLIALGSSGYTG